jgi:predicted GIY-YIG superfamily endonuclease
MTPKGSVYLIHFHTKLHRAGHYLGWASDLDKRIERHKRGDGAAIMRAVVAKGIGFDVVRVFENVDRSFERRLKNRKKISGLCPTCREAKGLPPIAEVKE